MYLAKCILAFDAAKMTAIDPNDRITLGWLVILIAMQQKQDSEKQGIFDRKPQIYSNICCAILQYPFPPRI